MGGQIRQVVPIWISIIICCQSDSSIYTSVQKRKIVLITMFSQENTPVRVGVLDLLYKSQGSQYVIPAYQRNYTWTAGKEVRQLLDDLKEVLKGNYKQHFIGIMIYDKINTV